MKYKKSAPLILKEEITGTALKTRENLLTRVTYIW